MRSTASQSVALALALCPLLMGQVSGVEGPSWIKHIHTTFNETSMGRTWRLGPPPSAPGERVANWEPGLRADFDKQKVTLRGEDVYRLNCRGCHQETGHGAPPEINSIINPVLATSANVVMQRMKDRGMDISRASAEQLAKEATVAILQRLHQGGTKMPPFTQLRPTEIRSLLSYLKQLAGVPGAENEQVIGIDTSSLRVGEQIVKSNCHICHDAAGPNPSPAQILDGAIPPLCVLTRRTTLSQFVRKVTLGAPIMMGAPPLFYRGRMSVFYYLSEQEVASAYLYLTCYPPQK